MQIKPNDGNLANIVIFRQAERYSDKTALLIDEKQFSYRDIAGITILYANFLTQLGVQKGDKVLIAMPDSLGFVGAFFGILSIGAIAVPMAQGGNVKEAQHIVNNTNCTLALVDLSCGIRALDKCPVHIIDSESTNPFTTSTIKFKPTQSEPQDLAYILFSSGSTGPAKGIPHRHIDLLHCAESYADTVLKYHQDDVILCVPKLSFGYALGCNLVFSLLAGAASILIKSIPTREVLQNAAQINLPTVFIGQPRNLVSMIETGPNDIFRKLRLVVVAGEKLSPALVQRFNDVFPEVPLLDGYGTTEANAIFISNTVEESRLRSLGKPIPGYEVKLLRPSDQSQAQENEIGELWFKGPSACLEYWNDAVTTADRIHDGWIRTGDLFTRDSDGYYFLHGREDDMLKVGCGDWINPTSIEDVIQKVDKIEECAVVGHLDGDGIIQLKAYILLVAGARQTRSIRDEILDAVKESFSTKPSHHIQVVEFVSSFPRTSTGKLHRKNLNSHTQLEFAYQC